MSKLLWQIFNTGLTCLDYRTNGSITLTHRRRNMKCSLDDSHQALLIPDSNLKLVVSGVMRLFSLSYSFSQFIKLCSNTKVSVIRWPTLQNPFIEEQLQKTPMFPRPSAQPTTYVESKADFEHVKRLLPPRTISPPPQVSLAKGESTPSGWVPPASVRPDLPYFVRRTRNHMLPVALLERERKRREGTHGVRQLTVLRHIDGDMWALEKDLRKVLQPLAEGHLLIQVDETLRKIRIDGIYLDEVANFLLSKGF